MVSQLRSECWEATPAGGRDDTVLVELVSTDRAALSDLDEGLRARATVIESHDEWLMWVGSVVPSRAVELALLTKASRRVQVRVHGGTEALSRVKHALGAEEEEI